jgi:sulfite reductase (ferredoxin)
LQGVQVPAEEGATTDGFDFFVGGGLGAQAAFARRIGFRTAAANVPEALQRLLLGYLAEREEHEQFHHWAAQAGDAHIKTLLSSTAP